MIQLSNLTAQVLTPGQALTFNNIIHQSRCCKSECFNTQLPTSVKMTGGNCSIYKVEFHGNISGAAGDILQLSLGLAGMPLVETEMRVIPSGDPNSNNVSTGTYIVIQCDDADRVSVMNMGTTNIAIAPNATLMVRRAA